MLTHREGVFFYDGNHFHDAAFCSGKWVGRDGRGDACISSYIPRRVGAPPSEAILWPVALTSFKMQLAVPFRRNIREAEDRIRGK